MMPSRFRSVRDISAGAGSRRDGRRTRPAVERSTFVIVELGGDRLALPAEGIERVIRAFGSESEVSYEHQQIPLVDLAGPLGRNRRTTTGADRVLVLSDGTRRWAVVVDAVDEVIEVDTATVVPVPVDHSDAQVPGVHGCFVRKDQLIPVIDALGILSRTAAGCARV